MTAGYNYEVDLQSELPGAEVFSLPGGGFNLKLWCCKCADNSTVYSQMKLPTDQFRKKLTQAGWHLHKRPTLHQCPLHRRQKETAPMPNPTKAGGLLESSHIALGVAASEAARIARREAMLLIGDVFDIETGRYKAGESDATVSACTKLSEDAVAKLREEFYGSLKMPSELEALQIELKNLQSNATKTMTDLQAEVLETRKLIDKDLGDLTRKIDNVIRINGWKA